MRTAKHTVRKSCLALFILSVSSALLIGAAPALFTVFVDPYELFGARSRASEVSELAEKDHYPLWKLARYRPGIHDTVILGDSRARALREKYWHELGMDGAINLAYGGGTIPEIHATFNLIKTDGAIRNVVIGIQLRSFDEKHKGGMNRVPEAVKLLGARTEYLKNWSVAKTAFKILKAENKATLDWLAAIRPALVASANAQEPGKVPLTTLLSPEICFSCPLRPDARPVPQTRPFGGYSIAHLPRFDLGDSRGLWHADDLGQFLPLYVPQRLRRVLPPKIRRQVDRNGPADWRGFELSARYWQQIEEIGRYARTHDINLIFVIPPTIVEMQETIQDHGLAELNVGLRAALADWGAVIDFDYPNTLTGEIGNFSDAYHFRPQIARAIVGELVSHLSEDEATRRLADKRRKLMRCPTAAATDINSKTVNPLFVAEDSNCRHWIGRAL